MLCNAEIKFKAFLDHALTLGADLIATGHYAKIREANGLFQLLKAEDGTKDQSYFLYRLNQAQLSKIVVPAGESHKHEVREHGARGWAAEGREEGFDGHLFHRRAAVPRIPQPLPAA